MGWGRIFQKKFAIGGAGGGSEPGGGARVLVGCGSQRCEQGETQQGPRQVRQLSPRWHLKTWWESYILYIRYCSMILSSQRQGGVDIILWGKTIFTGRLILRMLNVELGLRSLFTTVRYVCYNFILKGILELCCWISTYLRYTIFVADFFKLRTVPYL